VPPGVVKPLDMSILLLVLAILSVLYWVYALRSDRRLRDRRGTRSPHAPPVTVLKPVRGDDGQLYANLRSFCEQDYPHHEVLFGVASADDPAVPVIERLIGEFPHLDLACVVTSAVTGANRKVNLLEALTRRARHDILVIADADMRVGPDYLQTIVGALADPSVGLVTCLYRGVSAGGLASSLGAMFINEWFIPAVLVGARLGPLRYAFGATLACRREVLASIGGFAAVADYLADDYMIGTLVSRRGLRIALAPLVVSNIVVETDLRGLVLHELRWARTFRTVRPLAYACSIVTHGIPLAALLLLAAGPTPAAVGLLALHLAIRCSGRVALYRRLGVPLHWSTMGLVPVRDVLSFILWASSFLGREVCWAGERFRVDADGRLHPLVPARAVASQRGAEQTTGAL